MPTIFYAWQSDSPNRTNRAFIRRALGEAVTILNANLTIEETLDIDQDTQGVPGSPPVAETILKKISEADIFLGDVTLVAVVDKLKTEDGAAPSAKRYPNANVMIELGYALGKHGPERVLGVMNEQFGLAKDLPFDLGHRRHPIRFALTHSDDAQTRREVRRELVVNLGRAISAVLTVATKPPAEAMGSPNVFSSFQSAMGRMISMQTEAGTVEPLHATQPQISLRVRPTEAFQVNTSVQLQRMANNACCALRPLCTSGHSVSPLSGRTPSGFVTMLISEKSSPHRIVALTSLSQLGELSGINQHLLRENENLGGRRVIGSGALRRDLEASLRHYVEFSRKVLEIKGPLRITASLEIIEGIPLVLTGDRVSQPSNQPIVWVDFNLTTEAADAAAILRPLYEKLWDACGEEFSP